MYLLHWDKRVQENSYGLSTTFNRVAIIHIVINLSSLCLSFSPSYFLSRKAKTVNLQGFCKIVVLLLCFHWWLLFSLFFHFDSDSDFEFDSESENKSQMRNRKVRVKIALKSNFNVKVKLKLTLKVKVKVKLTLKVKVQVKLKVKLTLKVNVKVKLL